MVYRCEGVVCESVCTQGHPCKIDVTWQCDDFIAQITNFLIINVIHSKTAREQAGEMYSIYDRQHFIGVTSNPTTRS